MDIDAFSEHLHAMGLHPTTIRNYIVAAKAIDAQVHSFSPEEIKQFLIKKLNTISRSGTNKYVKAIKQYVAFKKLEGFEFVRKYKEQPKSRVMLTDDEIESIISCDKTDVYWIFWSVLAYTGARPGEICALQVQDIDQSLHILYIHHTKTGEARQVPILDALKEVLYPYLKTLKTRLLFPVSTNPKKPISHASYMKNWRSRLKKCDILKRPNPYCLRHSFLTNALGNGANLYAIQDMVGQKDSNVTKRYYHGNLDLMRKAARKLPLAQKKEDPRALVDQFVELMREFLADNVKFNKEEILEAEKHLYRSINSTSEPED